MGLKEVVVIGRSGKEITYSIHRGGNKLGGRCSEKKYECEGCNNINC